MKSPALAAVALLLFPAVVLTANPSESEVLLRAQELIDAEQPAQAVALLDPYLKKHPGGGRGFLLRSTASIMLGDVKGGRKDLDRALKNDPTLRQAWLNRAALDLAELRYDQALSALLQAQELDPVAPDNHLNLGAVILLQGRLGPASEHFESYLELNPDSAEAYYLVASNYAMAEYAALAIEHLRRAVEFDERFRLRARTDANFANLSSSLQFQELLATDTYRPPSGSYTAARSYPVAYDANDGVLLGAVIDSLRTLGEPFDGRVEVTSEWALVWGGLRIRVARGTDGTGIVEVSSPPERFTPQEWRQRVDRLFKEIAVQLPPSHRQRRP
jgi:tetratricopeptide (TPR) repeat protein